MYRTTWLGKRALANVRWAREFLDRRLAFEFGYLVPVGLHVGCDTHFGILKNSCMRLYRQDHSQVFLHFLSFSIFRSSSYFSSSSFSNDVSLPDHLSSWDNLALSRIQIPTADPSATCGIHGSALHEVSEALSACRSCLLFRTPLGLQR